MRYARDERGFALVTAIVFLMVMMGLGLGLLMYANSQQRAAGNEQASEAAFNLAEAALNAQVTQLAQRWPGAATTAFPSSCTAATSTATNGCPSSGSLSAGYPNLGSGTCPAGTGTEAWGSSGNGWTTYVRDPGTEAGSSEYFNSTAEETKPSWDESVFKTTNPGKLWVRSVGIVQCHVASLVTLVSQQYLAANFPRNTVTANWFKIGNEGKGSEEVIDTRGKSSQPGNVSMRCTGFKTEAECKQFREGQVVANTTKAPGTPSPTLSNAQLEALKEQAEWSGTYYPSGSCPKGETQLTGHLVYAEGPCTIEMKGNEVVNSEAAPGFLIIINGTFSMQGTSQFYGEVYDANHQESTEVVVTIKGNPKLHGGINVDGNGGMEIGQSHKKNLEFEPTAIDDLQIYAGVSPTRNSFRVLPAGQ